jgi:hypothetical protein
MIEARVRCPSNIKEAATPATTPRDDATYDPFPRHTVA